MDVSTPTVSPLGQRMLDVTLSRGELMAKMQPVSVTHTLPVVLRCRTNPNSSERPVSIEADVALGR